jgi:hypothetical protein
LVTGRASRQPDADEENHEQHGAERDAEAQRRECRSDQSRRVAPAHRGHEHRKRREIEQRNRERGTGRDRCEHQGGREARGNADQNELHHLQLSRSLERLEIPSVSDQSRNQNFADDDYVRPAPQPFVITD